MDAASDETSDMGHVGHEEHFFTCLLGDFVANLGDALKIWDFHESRVADEDELWLVFESEAFHLFVVYIAFVGNTVANEIIEVRGHCNRCAVCEVTAGRKRHAEHGIAWFAPCVIDGSVGLSARVWLNVGVVGMKEAASAVYRETLHTIYVFLTTVITVVW